MYLNVVVFTFFQFINLLDECYCLLACIFYDAILVSLDREFKIWLFAPSDCMLLITEFNMVKTTAAWSAVLTTPLMLLLY
jgi:hypothetical protein